MPAITSQQVSAINNSTLRSADDIRNWTQKRLGGHFLPWFNQMIANRGAWTGIRLVDTESNQAEFYRFWEHIGLVAGPTPRPMQFLALMGIFANECRANFTPVTERMGRPGYPGLTYLFDAIPGLKRSYNTLAGNQTAFQCFHRTEFHEAHGEKAMAEQLRATSDLRWAGTVYPRDVRFDNLRTMTGYIMEADFMKFRGRGFVQTTGRANYRPLIHFVQRYGGADEVLQHYQELWRGRTADVVAFTSSNDDWDRLFQETDLRVAAEAVRLHNVSAGNYLALAGDPDRAIVNMGRRISGGAEYAKKYRDRMEELIVQVLT